MKTSNINNTTDIRPVDLQKSQQADQARKGKEKDKASRSGRQADTYNVNLSPAAKQLSQDRAKAMEIAQQTSPIREDRISELKAKIQSGEYKVDSGKIADGILLEAVKDQLALNE